ncbi:MAG: arginase family protein [Rhizobiaceae bacterium]|nr:arginase family protein [Rhizobiaceae bacterium]MCV0404686.1 arginase family protein [Rhizobiaceae bacterium]
MKLSMIVAPYDSGRRHEGFGRGPDALLAGGLVETLTLSGHDVDVVEIARIEGLDDREIATGFAVCRAVAEKAIESRAVGRFPVILAGNCLTACGAVAGEDADSIIWFDQHGDLNTPETSPHGFLDGMALATALGLCWRPMANAIPGFRPVDPAKCMLVDARDLDPDEEALLAGLPVIHSEASEAADKVSGLKEAGARRTHLHIDLDVHDADVLRVNRYATPGGPAPDLVRQVASRMASSVPIVGLTLSAYDPAFDAKGDVPPVVGRLLVDFLAAMERA